MSVFFVLKGKLMWTLTPNINIKHVEQISKGCSLITDYLCQHSCAVEIHTEGGVNYNNFVQYQSSLLNEYIKHYIK